MRGEMSERQMGHIGIIDHDALVREGLKDCMESAGYSVEPSVQPRSFWRRSSSQLRASCLIVDIRFLGISGLELQRRLSNCKTVSPSFSLRRTELTQPVNRHSGTEQRRFCRNPSVAKNC